MMFQPIYQSDIMIKKYSPKQQIQNILHSIAVRPTSFIQLTTKSLLKLQYGIRQFFPEFIFMEEMVKRQIQIHHSKYQRDINKWRTREKEQSIFIITILIIYLAVKISVMVGLNMFLPNHHHRMSLVLMGAVAGISIAVRVIIQIWKLIQLYIFNKYDERINQ